MAEYLGAKIRSHTLKRYLPRLIGLYIILLPFTNLLRIPLLGKKIQLPEIVFLSILVITLFNYKTFLKTVFPFKYGDLLLLLLPFSYLVSGNFSFYSITLNEFFGLSYLVVLFWICRWVFLEEVDHLPSYTFKYFNYCSLTAAIPAIIGWALAWAGMESLLVRPSDIYYPYLGNIPRGQGFTQTPGMLITILGICFILKIVELDNKQKISKWDGIMLLILTLGMVTTLAKSMLLIFGAALFYFIKRPTLSVTSILRLSKSKIGKRIMTTLIIVLVGGGLLGTHVFILKNRTLEEGMVQYSEYPSVIENKYLVIKGTIYWSLKKAAISIGQNAGMTGIGVGKFPERLAQAQSEGKYPEQLLIGDPHCTYTGLYVEMGWLGLLLMIVLGGYIVLTLMEWKLEDNFGAGLISLFFLMFLESISVDILNFRHYWIILAIYAAYHLIRRQGSAE